MAENAIRESQRGMVAIGTRNLELPDSQLSGTGFLIDMPSGIVVTCTHLILDAYHRKHASRNLVGCDPGVDGLAIGIGGIGEGETIEWRCHAKLLAIKRPWSSYAKAIPSHWSVSDDGTDGTEGLNLAILQLVRKDGSPLLEEAAGVLAYDGLDAHALALPLPTFRISHGEELVALGYGGSNLSRTAVTSRGSFTGHMKDTDGNWLSVSMNIHLGQLGGPAINRGGAVVGWVVRSEANRPTCHLKPIAALEAALTSVLQCLGRDVSGGLRTALMRAAPAFQPVAADAGSSAASSDQQPPAKRTRLTVSWLRPAVEIEWKEELGRGSFGIAYKVVSRGQHMAAKKIVITVASEYKQALHSLEHEFVALSQLNHENVLQPLGAVIDAPGWVALLTELMLEGSLRKMLDERPAVVTEDKAAQLLLARGIASGMACLHEHGTLHHDLKSANVLLKRRSDGHLIAKVADFGLATSNSRSTLHASKVGNHGAATLLYKAPELFSKGNSFEKPSEVYAFGILLWEMVTGEEPWKDMELAHIMMAVVMQDERPPLTVEQASAVLAQFAQRCWQKDLELRPTFDQLKREFLAIPDPLAPVLASQSHVVRLEQRVEAHDLAVGSLGLHDPTLVAKVKRATLRIGLYQTATNKLVDLGSGTLIDAGPGNPVGQVLSAAHVFLKTSDAALPPKYLDSAIDWNSPAAPFIILVGLYQAEGKSSNWAFWAELVTPLNVLQQTKAKPWSNTLVDLAVLQIRGEIEMSPAVYTGPTLTESFTVVKRSAAASPLSLPEGIQLGDPSLVQTGISTVTVFGWFAPSGETTLYVPQHQKIMSTANGLLISQALLHSAGSGGGMFDSQGRLLAVNSLSRNPALPMPAEYKAYGRMISDLHSGHGLQA